MRNHEIFNKQKLLIDGSLQEPGWSRSLLQVYNRKDIKANKLRIKEWDYYLITSEDIGIALTLSDDGYIGLQSVSFLDFKRKFEHTETILDIFPLGKRLMPYASTSGISYFQNKRLTMRFEVTSGKRTLDCTFKNFYHKKDFTCHILLEEPPMDSMVIATPWKDKKYAFYYNQKINCMKASGNATFDGKQYTFDDTCDYGTLDWGRGVWTYDNTWYWGSGNTTINGLPFGFNIGYGFGDTSAASENILFYNGIGHKLDDIEFHVPSDLMQKWQITSSDHRFDMTFTPLLDRYANISVLIIASNQHQVFGYLSGTAILDDGTKLHIDRMLCFCEVVHNCY